jgi:acetoin utilization deacetylase AcuC-like enzyme
MIIYAPPPAHSGAPNLTKGAKVFDAVVISDDDVIMHETDITETLAALKRVHRPEFIDDVMSGQALNGYFDTDTQKNLHSLRSCAILTAAAIHAISSSPTFAPVAGFHHACYSSCGGYCTFNGLVMAAAAVKDLNPQARVLIIDGDGHFGNGTEQLIQRDRPWLENLSLDLHTTSGNHSTAMTRIDLALAEKWDLVIYQAGADSHAQDPYAAGYLSDEEWVERDRLIFGLCKETSIPIVFNLAGGYNGPKTVELHASTVKTCREIYGR